MFVESDSVDGIAEGLRIPKGAQPLPADVRPQRDDPDVVAVKSVALAVLRGAEADTGLIDKIVEAVFISAHPLEGAQKDTCKITGQRG